MPIASARADRVVRAVLHNLDDWMGRLREIEENATPGNKVRLLALLRDMEQSRVGLRRLAGPLGQVPLAPPD